MKQQIEALIQQSGAKTVAVAFHDLEMGRELLIRPDVTFHPASTFKLCVMLELFRQAELGELSLEDRLPIKNEFQSLVDGSPYSLSVMDDSETTLYGRIGERESLRELNRLMIVRSSNLATNLLVERVTAARVTRFMHELGAVDLLVRRGVEDNKAYALGLNNVATAGGLMQVLVRLADRQVVSERVSDVMIGILQAQEFNEGIPAGLPAGMKVAHKTGWNERLYHDAAIVFPPHRKPYVLVVMTQGLPELKEAPALVAAISRLLCEETTQMP